MRILRTIFLTLGFGLVITYCIVSYASDPSDDAESWKVIRHWAPLWGLLAAWILYRVIWPPQRNRFSSRSHAHRPASKSGNRKDEEDDDDSEGIMDGWLYNFLPWNQEEDASVDSVTESLGSSSASLSDSVSDSVSDSLTDSVSDSVSDSLTDSLSDSVSDSVSGSFFDGVSDSFWDFDVDFDFDIDIDLD